MDESHAGEPGGEAGDGAATPHDVRMEAVFRGRVQGVFFRATTERIAAGFPVTGWVRNEPDGSVRLVAEGPRETLQGFLDHVLAERREHVDDVEVTFTPARGDLAGFRIVR